MKIKATFTIEQFVLNNPDNGPSAEEREKITKVLNRARADIETAMADLGFPYVKDNVRYSLTLNY